MAQNGIGVSINTSTTNVSATCAANVNATWNLTMLSTPDYMGNGSF